MRASLLETNRAADSKPRRFDAEQGMCVPMLAAEAKIGVDSGYRTVLLQGGRGSGGIAAALRPMEERCEGRSCAGRRLVFVRSRLEPGPSGDARLLTGAAALGRARCVSEALLTIGPKR